MHKPLAALALVALSGLAQAEISRPDPRVDAIPDSARWVFSGAVVSGGDKLAMEVEVDSGVERDRIRTGALYQLAFGALFPIAEDWAVQATLGLNRDSMHSNVDETKGHFNKKFVEVIPYYGVGRHRFGLGVTYYYDSKFSWNGDEEADNVNATIEFEQEAAPTVAYDWFYSDSLALGLRYTSAHFEVDSYSRAGVRLNVDHEYDADSFGAQVSYFF